MWPLLTGADARTWLLALCFLASLATCVAESATAHPGGFTFTAPKSGSFGWGAATAAAALAMQLLLAKESGEEMGEGLPVNGDKDLTWREDEGVTKLVPIAPLAVTQKLSSAKLPTFSLAEVAKHNARDDLWIVVDERVYDITSFLDKHPGGIGPVLNMAGKDCTDVFANYHAARVYKTMLPSYLIGEVSGVVVPPHVEDFRAVRQELLRRGLFETDHRFYAKLGCWLAALFCGALWLSLACESASAHMAGAAVMGLFWQQLAGVGHDLGHSGVTHSFHTDHRIGSVCAALMGLSTCWWKSDHNTHHVVCNSVEHDPNIQHMPLLAVAPGSIAKPFYSSYHAKWFQLDAATRAIVSRQHFFFYPLMMVARINLYIQGWIFLLAKKETIHYRKLEALSLGLFHLWVGAVMYSMPTSLQSICWILVAHAVSGLLHVQIVLSHWSMHTYSGHAYNGAKDEWYITQLLTTLNVDCPEWMDWFYIGLQFQIEHHLFPRLPRHNLRKARELVKGVCKKHNLPYHEPGFFAANLEMWEQLRATARRAATSKRGSSGFFESALWQGANLQG